MQGDVGFVSKCSGTFKSYFDHWLYIVALNAKVNCPCGPCMATHVAPFLCSCQSKIVCRKCLCSCFSKASTDFFLSYTALSENLVVSSICSNKNNTRFHLHRLIVYYYKMLKDSNEKKIKLLKEQISMVRNMHSLIHLLQ